MVCKTRLLTFIDNTVVGDIRAGSIISPLFTLYFGVHDAMFEGKFPESKRQSSFIDLPRLLCSFDAQSTCVCLVHCQTMQGASEDIQRTPSHDRIATC